MFEGVFFQKGYKKTILKIYTCINLLQLSNEGIQFFLDV